MIAAAETALPEPEPRAFLHPEPEALPEADQYGSWRLYHEVHAGITGQEVFVQLDVLSC